MTTLTLVLFILLLPLCLFLIGLILLQGGAGDISSAFGGGGQLDSTLGVGAGRKMSKITGWLSGAFMVIVLLLSVQHAGDFGKAAGPNTKPATLPIGDGLAPTPPPTFTDPAVVPGAAPAKSTTTVPAVVPAPGTVVPQPAPVAPAVEQPAPVPTTPAAEKPAVLPVAPAVQPTAPAPVVPAPVVPAPVVEKPAEQPAPAPTQPAAAPAPASAPRSGITLDEPAK